MSNDEPSYCLIVEYEALRASAVEHWLGMGAGARALTLHLTSHHKSVIIGATSNTYFTISVSPFHHVLYTKFSYDNI